jgi:hypothetical protein
VKRILKVDKTDSHEDPPFLMLKNNTAPRKKQEEFNSFMESVV